MPRIVDKAEHDGLFFTIEAHQPAVGAYLYILFPDGQYEDYLQDTIQLCREFALEEFGLPLHCWRPTGWLYTDDIFG
jgi:hypothetical protein